MLEFLLSLAGFVALAVSVPRHCRHVFGRALHKSIMPVLRGAGWLLLASSLVVSYRRWGALFGSVTWFGMLTVSAVTVTLLLTYSARLPWLRRLRNLGSE